MAGQNRGVENVADKPKITGLSFNIFAIASVFILLPLATAWVSTLANANTEELDDITTDHSQDMMYDPNVCGQTIGGANGISYDDAYSLTWITKGLNSTNDYMIRDNIPSNEYERYESISKMPSSGNTYYQMAGYCGTDYIQRDESTFVVGVDDHRWLNSNHYLYGANPNYGGYIGYSGDEFTFRVNTNQMKYIDNNKDISTLKISFIDYQAGFSCDNPIFQNVETVGDITLGQGASPYGTFLTYENFNFQQVNSFKVGFAPNSGLGTININDFCHIGLEFEFDFSPLESIEISETFNKNYDNMHLRITLRDFKFNNVTAVNISAGSSNAPIPFTGDDNFGFNFQVGYVDTTRANFFLSGGTLIMGLGLFGLAIANTPYWNPVVNFFKPRGA